MNTSKSAGNVSQKTEPHTNCFNVKLKHGLSVNRYVLPHIICRTSLFAPTEYRGANAARRPTFTEPTLIGEWGKSRVFQIAGERLTQFSKDVYIELVRMSLELELQPNERIVLNLSANHMLNAVGRKLGTQNRKQLARELNRLKHASFRFEIDGIAWETGFILDIVENNRRCDAKTQGHFLIEMNPRMDRVFQSGWTLPRIDYANQFRKRNDTLAMWLYDFYESHDGPFAMYEHRLMAQAGRSQILNSRLIPLLPGQSRCKWLAELKVSLSILQMVTGWSTQLVKGKNGLKVVIEMPRKSKEVVENAVVIEEQEDI